MADLRNSGPPPLSAVIPGRGDQAVTVAQLVTLLEHVREELLADSQEKHDRLHRQMTDESTTVVPLLNRIIASLSVLGTDCRNTRSRGSSSGRRSVENQHNVQHIEIFESADTGASEYLQYLILITVMAFISNFPNAALWVASQTQSRMQKLFPILRQVSGLSLLLFAVRATDAKSARMRSAMGQARSILVKWTLARKVSLTRDAIQNAQTAAGVASADVVDPVWLASFGNARDTRKRISDIIAILDNGEDIRPPEVNRPNSATAALSLSSEVPGLPPSSHERRKNKRRRINSESQTDPVLQAQMHAVRSARKKLLRALSHGRSEVRKKLFTNLLFVLERVWSFENPALASENGYAVILSQNSPEDDIVPVIGPGLPEDSPWRIPLALRRGQDSDENVRDVNRGRFIDLQRSFPGLAVKLKYKINVRRGPNDRADGLQEFGDPELSIPGSDDVSLHSVAASCLLGSSRASNFDEVLQTSELSLRAIHVIAIGLRGLLKKALQGSGAAPHLSDLEKCALGDVTARLVQKGDPEVTAMFGSGTKEPGEGAESVTELEKLRRSKLEISWSEYRKRRAAEAVADRTAFSDDSQSASDNSSDEGDWVENADI